MSESLLLGENVDLDRTALVQKALEREEGVLSANGALTVTTGKRTGRSPNDKFIVEDEITRTAVDWGKVNRSTTPEVFSRLWAKAEAYLAGKESFVANLQVGAHADYALPVTVVTELAWHNLFARNLFVEPSEPLAQEAQRWTVFNVPGLQTDPAQDGTYSDGVVMLDFTKRQVLICGIRYAGEMKKAMFTVLNFALPAQDVLPMHCAANLGEAGDVTLFFGLSGTGKTTLSSDPERFLIGDDEHGWGTKGVFNFEGGCYAKCIDLSQQKEPVIWDAIKAGAVMENVVLRSDTKVPDFADSRLTKNTRVAYPLTHIDKRVANSQGGSPRAVVFLTCDLYGVLPPVSLLSTAQAAYYFLSGYTALVGSTEIGSSADISSTFSACFGAPFFPRAPQVYADLLIKRVEESGAQVYLVNTGWTGGGYGTGGQRFDIDATRQIIRAIVEDTLRSVDTEVIPGFDLVVPKAIDGVDSAILNPRLSWDDPSAYDAQARILIEKFVTHASTLSLASAVRNAGPKLD